MALLFWALARPRQPRNRSDGAEIAAFYRSRGGAPLWFSPRSGAAAQQLVQLLATAQADNLNPGATMCAAFSRAFRTRATGNPAAVQRAEAMFSAAFVAYARDQRHDPGVGVDLRRSGAAADAALCAASCSRRPRSALARPNMSQQMGWMNPIYAKLRQAIAEPDLSQRGGTALAHSSISSARGRFPSGNGRYVIVNPPAARLYMYENGQVVDSMRVVAGRPDPIAQTPMMNAFIRYVALNPYWNSPPDITARRLPRPSSRRAAPISTKRGYELCRALVRRTRTSSIPMSVDWQQSPPARCRSICARSPGPRTRWAR